MNPVVERILQTMKERGINQKEFAKKIGVRPQAITEWKNGTTSSYTRYLQQISSVLEVSVDYLLYGEVEVIPINNREIADRIFALLDQTDMEQQEFAQLVGVSDDTASDWRRHRSESFMKRLGKIASVLETSVDYLHYGKEKEQPTANDDGLTEAEQQLITLFRRLPPEQQDFVISAVQAAASKQ